MRGVYYVYDSDLAAFMQNVDSDFTVIIQPFKWACPDADDVICVFKWLVVLQ